MRVIAEFTEHPGGEDYPETGLAGVDLSVRVLAKMRLHHRRNLLDLGVQRRDDRTLAGHDRGVVGLHRRRPAQLLSSEDLLDLGGPGFDVAPVRPPQRSGDAASGQPPGAIRIRGSSEQFDRIGCV